MSRVPPSFLLIGVDSGSREAVAPLAAFAAFAVQSTDAADAGCVEHWEKLYDARGIRGIVVGTSDSAPAREIEAAARLAASRRMLKVIAIEDYPGNFFDVEHARTDLLIAESTLSEQIYRERLGTACPPIMVFCSPRYDRYRVQADSLRAATRARWNARQGLPLILWAGQPEAQDNLETLRRLGPAMCAVQATLLVKAHPRDPLGQHGIYSDLLNRFGIEHVDVSALTVAASLEQAPHLVVTQFSSLAIEAGFYGIPALHMLYGDVGGALLRQKKGFDVPPHCQCGASLVVRHSGREQRILRQALFDQAARDSVINCFDDFFETRTVAAPRLADHLATVMDLA